MNQYIADLERHERISKIINGLGFIAVVVAALLITGQPV